MGAASTTQQNQPVIMEYLWSKKAHAEQETKNMFLSVICWCTHSCEGLNSMPGTYRPRPAMQLHCSSKKQHLHVVITKAFSWVHNSQGVHQFTWKANSSTAVSWDSEHFSSPANRLFWSVLTVLYLHALHHLYPHTDVSPHHPWTGRLHSWFTLLKIYSQKNTGFVVCLRSSTQISRASTALPTMLNIWKSCWSKFNLLLCKMALQSSEPLELLL